MNEMLYGNTGQNDECLNMDMDQALFARVKSKTFVHAVRKVLNPLRPIPDNSFIYIGSVEEKGNAYTLYGYQAKLRNDSRGGDYGNYIALPCDKKKAVLNFQQVKFATEEGWNEFCTTSTINDAKRFSIAPMTTPLNKNALKLLVNNILEMMMGTGKISNISFSFSNEADEDFSQKAIYVLAVAMKYLPYRMRKNIAFISRVDANAKIPTMINVAAFAANNSAKPRDCVDVEHECGELTTGIFKDYVNKVFSMDDASREAYLEKLYTEIEAPLMEKNLVVKSSHYLLETETKPLWETGSDEAIRDIFATTNEVAAVFPAYTEIAKKVMEENSSKVVSYLSESIAKIKKNEELKKLYTNTKNLFNACGFDITKGALPLFVKKTDELFISVEGKDEILGCADTIKSISPDLFGSVAKEKLGKLMESDSLDGFFEVYKLLKSKKYMSDKELNAIAQISCDKVIISITDGLSESKDKLDILTAKYENFASGNPGSDIGIVTTVFNKYKTLLSGSANTEAIKSGEATLREIMDNLKYYNEFGYFATYFEKIVKIDVDASTNLRANTERVYGALVDRFFGWLMEKDVAGSELMDAIDRIAPCVDALEKRNITGGRAVMLTPNMKGVPDGIGRLMEVFKALERGLKNDSTLGDALKKFDELNQTIMPTETRCGTIFKKHAPVIVKRWTKHGKFKNATSKDLQSALKKLGKDYKINDEKSIAKFIDKYDTIPEERASKKKGGLNIKLIIIIAVAALVVIGAAVGVLFGTGIIGGDTEATDTTQGTEKYVDQAVINEVEDYLDSFVTADAPNKAEVMVGEIKENFAKNSNGLYETTVYLSETEFNKMILMTIQDVSKNFMYLDAVTPGQKFAFVVQVVGEGENAVYYIRDVIVLPAMSSYDVEKGSISNAIVPGEDENETKALHEFYNKLVQYVGVMNTGDFMVEQVVSEDVIEEIDAYLASFGKDETAPAAKVVVGQIGSKLTDDDCVITLKDGSSIKVKFEFLEGVSKNLTLGSALPINQPCAFVVQEMGEVSVVRDAVILPTFKTYVIGKENSGPGNLNYSQDEAKDKELLSFYHKLVQYTGVKTGELKLAKEEVKKGNEENIQEPEKNTKEPKEENKN